MVDEIEDEDTDLTVDAAKQYKRDAVVGDFVDIPLETHDLGRIAAQTAKHVIRQGIREAERGSIMQEFRSKQQEIVTARIERIDPITGNASLAMDNFQATLVKMSRCRVRNYTRATSLRYTLWRSAIPTAARA